MTLRGDIGAPPLDGLPEFVQWADGEGLHVVRSYVPAWQDDETGEQHPESWCTDLLAEQAAGDKFLCYVISLCDQDVLASAKWRWEHLGKLVKLGLSAYAEQFMDHLEHRP